MLGDLALPAVWSATGSSRRTVFGLPLRPPVCRLMQDGLRRIPLWSPCSYAANVQCRLADQPIQFSFSKRYDHPWHGVVLSLTVLLLWYGCYRLFQYVLHLQQAHWDATLEAERGRAAASTGARMVHDLKKGLLSRLNRLRTGADDGQLQEHFRDLSLLNKFVDLLGRNLKGERETDRVRLDANHFRKYLEWVLGSVTLDTKPLSGRDMLRVRLWEEGSATASRVTLEAADPMPEVWVPEISFYRLLKNIIENYHTYGCGDLELAVSCTEREVLLRASNEIDDTITGGRDSTRLGMDIMRQVLHDNFGSQAGLVRQNEAERFSVVLHFPRERNA